MTIIAEATRIFERLPLADTVSRWVIGRMVARSGRRLSRADAAADTDFASAMQAYPIAEHTELANRQHYELPPEFFALMLGPWRKYSCCFYETPSSSLAEAETAALARTAHQAGLTDGQEILELGCGWGSLSLWMAKHLPRARITAVSNSTAQRLHIEAEAKLRGLINLTVITADMNQFDPSAHGLEEKADRIISIEMFEHMANWHELLNRARLWLKPDGRLFVHVFTHCRTPYRFDPANGADWIAQHFFTGGIMPSQGLMLQFADVFTVEEEWRWSGAHYARTARDWLEQLDCNHVEARRILAAIYGRDRALWHRRWRLFLLATEALFGHAGGSVWGIGQYRLKPNPNRRSSDFEEAYEDAGNEHAA